jgi:uncharacterized protein (TIGR02145 family)
LAIQNTLSWKFPLPDKKVSVYNGATLIWYQWEAWDSVLRLIKLSAWWWRDPLKDSFYTYTANTKQSKFQLLAFLENKDGVAINFNPMDSSKTYATDYTGYPYVKWDGIPALFVETSSWVFTPLQDNTGTWVDLSTSPTWVYSMTNNSVEPKKADASIAADYNEPSAVKTVADCGTVSWKVIYGTADWSDSALTCNDEIIICNWVSWSWHIIAACNAWASTVFSGQTFTSATTARNSSVNGWAGWLYQWWNKAEISFASTVGWQELNCQNSSASSYSAGAFRFWVADWCLSPNDNLWWDTTKTDISRTWPCASWYHVPTQAEWQAVNNAWNGTTWSWANIWAQFSKALKLPIVWERAWDNGWLMLNQWVTGIYWTSTSGGASANTVFVMWNSLVTNNTSSNKAFGFPVRCVKNNVVTTPVTPVTVVWICGTANGKTYANTDTSFWSDTMCARWTSNPSSVDFPEKWTNASWSCAAADWSVNCSATRSADPGNGNPPPSWTVAYNCDHDDITLPNGQVWQACNVWASTTEGWDSVPVQDPAFSATIPTSDRSLLWDYFQWGRNIPVTTGSPTNDKISDISDTSDDFVMYVENNQDQSDYNWFTSFDDDMWGWFWSSEDNSTHTKSYTDMTEEQKVKMQGPCITWYHVPTMLEWADAEESVSQEWEVALRLKDLQDTLLIPYAWSRQADNWLDGQYQVQWKWARFWTASTWLSDNDSIHDHWTIEFWTIWGDESAWDETWFWSTQDPIRWLSVRCLKNND